MMKRTAVLTTTHIDRHNESMSVEALEAIARHINEGYLPFGVDHDPRIPPIGRVASAQVRPLPDDHFELIGEIELFEEGDRPEIATADRTAHVHLLADGEFEIAPDRSHRSREDIEAISEVAAMLKTSPTEQMKKAVEPISLLELGGAFILANVATGFLTRIGEDAYDRFKTRLKFLFRRRRADKKDRLLVFHMTLADGEHRVSAEIILTNPTDADIDAFFSVGLREIDAAFPKVIRGNPDAVRFVAEWKDSSIQLTYAVMRNGLPFMPR